MQKPIIDFLSNARPGSLSRWWLLLGCTAVAIAGLFSLVLFIARTPGLSALPFFVNLFHASIVVHVDLSVLVWFLCIACLMWSLLVADKPQPMPWLEESALVSMAGGMLFITLSPLTGAAPLMSNYIPVIMSPVFFLGLSLVLCGTLLMLLRLFLSRPLIDNVVRFGIYAGGWIALIAIAAFVWSFRSMPPVIDGQQYYELLFWGGGHVLQYLHTQMLLVVWLVLIAALKPEFSISNRWLWILFLVTPLAALLTPLGYMHEVTSSEHRVFFTHMMIGVGGLAPAVLALFLIPAARRKVRNALWPALAMSLLLFIMGGVFGMMIEGQNVVIPAHYHGSIIGITIAFMGVAYLLLPKFGYRDPTNWKLAYWQPFVYGFGQLLHISGLAWSGGYGVLRKTPGGLADISMNVKAALGLMGLGGTIAAIGGLMFVIVVIKSVLPTNKHHDFII